MAKKVLVICEGKKSEPRLFRHAAKVFGSVPDVLEIVAYGSNLYDLYRVMEEENGEDWENGDLLLTLSAHEKDAAQKEILSGIYTDILLVFDFDPQDTAFSFRKVERMVRFFRESSDMGKLYLSYPMAEAFWHTTKKEMEEAKINRCSAFWTRTFSTAELREHRYKERVAAMKQRFMLYSAKDAALLLRLHAEKAARLAAFPAPLESAVAAAGFHERLLRKENEDLSGTGKAAVVSAALFYFLEAYPNIILWD